MLRVGDRHSAALSCTQPVAIIGTLLDFADLNDELSYHLEHSMTRRSCVMMLDFA
jgi:hypothetical protein